MPMKDTLPTGFEEWHEEAQREFLIEARKQGDLIALLLTQAGIEAEPPSNKITKGMLADLIIQLVNDDD